MLDHLKKTRFRGRTNMSLRLTFHLSDFEQRRRASRLARWNIYVLTDGSWEDASVKQTIRDTVSRLTTLAVPQMHFGIQFIQFGDHPLGTRRLEELDRLDKLTVAPLPR